jgi:hypothetical protein
MQVPDVDVVLHVVQLKHTCSWLGRRAEQTLQVLCCSRASPAACRLQHRLSWVSTLLQQEGCLLLPEPCCCHLLQAATQAAEVQQVEPELWQQRVCHDSRVALLASLPAGLLHQLAALTGCRRQQHMQLAELGADIKGRQEVAHAVVKGRQDALLRQGLGRLVGASSKRQAVAGVLMAGPVRAVKYLGAKVAKAWKSKSNGA